MNIPSQIPVCSPSTCLGFAPEYTMVPPELLWNAVELFYILGLLYERCLHSFLPPNTDKGSQLLLTTPSKWDLLSCNLTQKDSSDCEEPPKQEILLTRVAGIVRTPISSIMGWTKDPEIHQARSTFVPFSPTYHQIDGPILSGPHWISQSTIINLRLTESHIVILWADNAPVPLTHGISPVFHWNR